MKLFSYLVPALVCALVSFAGMFGAARGLRIWQPLFFAFLPACFVYVGVLMHQMSKEIFRLRRRVAHLEEKRRVDVLSASKSNRPPES